ncbi:MAG: hypothetical protein F6K04_18155 [Leptolyngbya sp. SIO4C5]|nr:hypothetical protein [Leptolyngbya sp. SIO4C5]
MNEIKGYFAALVNPALSRNAVKVAAIVGSMLMLINHGPALIHNRMTGARWASALLTYFVPYGVNIHGQYISQRQPRK